MPLNKEIKPSICKSETKKEHIIINRVISSHLVPMSIETPYTTLVTYSLDNIKEADVYALRPSPYTARYYAQMDSIWSPGLIKEKLRNQIKNKVYFYRLKSGKWIFWGNIC